LQATKLRGGMINGRGRGLDLGLMGENGVVRREKKKTQGAAMHIGPAH